MKKTNAQLQYTTLLLVLLGWVVSLVADAQGLSLSYPLNNSVQQRRTNNGATVTIAGQVIASSNPQAFSLRYRINRINANGSVAFTGLWNALTIQTTGLYYTTTTVNTGWYQVEVGFASGSPNTASAKFGVGDVYVIAGQSNAQGGSNFLPSTSGLPEWITYVNQPWVCRRDFPGIGGFLNMVYSSGPIAPSGTNLWCYGVLGKRISDAESSGVPVAFFNTAAGGSTVKNWSDGAAGSATGNRYTGGVQWCSGAVSGQPNSYYHGQPYLTLKNTLNYYASIHGVKAVLWHQGEADADPESPPSGIATTDQTTYANRLQSVINTSRTDFGTTNLAWMISKATFVNGGNITNSIRNAQDDRGNATNKGPDTDYEGEGTGANTGSRRGDGTHFYETNNNGVTFLADKWWGKISSPGPSGFGPIEASPVPALTVSRSGSNRILSVAAVGGASEYRWGTDINNPAQSGPTLTSITIPTTISGGGNYRCFVRVGNNWRISQSVNLTCGGCRLGARRTGSFFGTQPA
jgi:hypothetical protein